MRTLVCLAVLLLLAPVTRGDQDTGLRLLRQARRAAQAGDSEAAAQLLAEARTEWPGSALIAHEVADTLAAEAAWNEALSEYGKGAREPYAGRAAFNSGVVQFRAAEQGLSEAGVPVDPSGLGEVTDPAPLIAAIDAAVPQLQEARRAFADSLRYERDEAARDSIAALTDRLDELAEMREELEKIEPPESDEEEDQDGDSEDEQEQQEDQDQGEQDPEEGEDQQPPEDDQQEPPEQDEPEDSEGEEDEQQQDAQVPPAPAPQPREPRELTPQQLAELLEALDDLEAEARRIDKLRREAQRQSVEKDW